MYPETSMPRRGVVPLPLQQVSPIDSCRHGADQHLTLTRARDRLGGEAEHFGAARGSDIDGAHGLRDDGHGKLTSFAAANPRRAKGLKSVRVSKASTPSCRLSH